MTRLILRYDGMQTEWTESPVRLGRAPDNDLVIDDPSLSRHHAEIRLERGRWVAHDLKSANGLWVAGVRKPSHPLKSGDTVTLGQVPVDIVQAGEAATAPSMPPLRKALIAALVLMIAGVLWMAQQKPDAVDTERPSARALALRTPPPPEGVTAERAHRAAEQLLEEASRSSAALAYARRAATWARELYGAAVPPQLTELEARIEAELAARFHRGRAAFVRARKLGRKTEADAALRMLRETFPRDDARAWDLDRLEDRR